MSAPVWEKTAVQSEEDRSGGSNAGESVGHGSGPKQEKPALRPTSRKLQCGVDEGRNDTQVFQHVWDVGYCGHDSAYSSTATH